ncbi:serine/arginine repetitive matrix protein 1-like isoform X2 [Wyeomyia smithii]|uniref:serine/arginine repetitive matrix protein 1-like isoform X2 n=1 Tax=Wyeomyia smithii TaxID=174621 RepID=UPI002468063A|nr:serine/arginine repetitive matrix protein 1-like isoform X2 [Wyeomyia smithii]
MGLKLRWFRRRITFEGIPSAPERTSRKKQHDTGITVIGVYRQSVNYEDYVEPSRSSYWMPTNQPIVTAAIRKPTTSTEITSPAHSSSQTTTSSAKRRHEQPVDKISPSTRVTSEPQLNGRIATPPEPSYSPPQPPIRRGLTKTKSTPNVFTDDGVTASSRLEITRSIEVLHDEGRKPVLPAIRHNTSSKAVPHVSREQSTTFGKVRSTSRSPSPPEENKVAEEYERDLNAEGLSHQLQSFRQPEYFNEILVKINEMAITAKSSEHNQASSIHAVSRSPPQPTKDCWPTEDDTEESFDDIFEKVKAHPKSPLPAVRTLSPQQSEQEISRAESTNDIQSTIPQPEPRTASVPEAQTKPLKSILKKRAPVPPVQQQQPDPPSPVSATVVPIPPPRSIRKEEPVVTKQALESPDKEDDDDYLSWNMVERHRSSINHTVAGRVDPDILKNVPSSLQQVTVPRQKPFANSRALQQEAPPRTLRGMRNQQQQRSSNEDQILGLNMARDSISRDSEASA